MSEIKAKGNLGNTPEMRQGRGGDPFLTFTVYEDKRRKNRDTGEWETVGTQRLNCTMGGPHVETYAGLLYSGARVTVWGEFFSREYQANDGTTGVSLDVRVDAIQVHLPRDRDARQGAQAASSWSGQTAAAGPPATHSGSQGGQWGGQPSAGGWGETPPSGDNDRW